MKLKLKGLNGLAGRVIAHGIRAWMSTLRYRVAYVDPLVDPIRGVGGPRLYVVWHENLLTPIYLRPNTNVAILVSQHRDADILEAIATGSGFDCVRGSTYRGGATALRELTKRGRQQHVVITPDGPRGPRRELAKGAVYLAAKLGVPIVPIAVAYDRCWRLQSWDRFAVPRPFTTGRVLLGGEVHVPTNTEREAIDASRRRVQAEFDRLSDEVESWAATGQIDRPVAIGRRARPSIGGDSEPSRPLAA